VLGVLGIGCGCFGERVKYLSKANFVISSKGTMRGESWSRAIWSHFIDIVFEMRPPPAGGKFQMAC
jgi:hypothetical protein